MSLGGHAVVPTADLQPFRAAVWVNKAHSTAELFINEHMLHLGGLRSQRLRGCKQPNQLTQHVCVSLARQVGGAEADTGHPSQSSAGYGGWNVAPKVMSMSRPPEPVNVLSLGKRVFAEKALPPNTL